MVWGYFTAQGVGYLSLIENGLDGDLYRQILSEEFLNTLTYYNLSSDDIIFQQDNDPKHTANLTKQCFVDNDIKTFNWPAKSLDFNPKKHYWNKENPC